MLTCEMDHDMTTRVYLSQHDSPILIAKAGLSVELMRVDSEVMFIGAVGVHWQSLVLQNLRVYSRLLQSDPIERRC